MDQGGGESINMTGMFGGLDSFSGAPGNVLGTNMNQNQWDNAANLGRAAYFGWDGGNPRTGLPGGAVGAANAVNQARSDMGISFGNAFQGSLFGAPQPITEKANPYSFNFAPMGESYGGGGTAVDDSGGEDSGLGILGGYGGLLDGLDFSNPFSNPNDNEAYADVMALDSNAVYTNQDQADYNTGHSFGWQGLEGFLDSSRGLFGLGVVNAENALRVGGVAANMFAPGAGIPLSILSGFAGVNPNMSHGEVIGQILSGVIGVPSSMGQKAGGVADSFMDQTSDDWGTFPTDYTDSGNEPGDDLTDYIRRITGG